MYFGAGDETLALFGFGLDSFVEVISGIGIAHLILRSGPGPGSVEINRDRFEKTALRVTGVSFFILAGGLVLGAALSLVTDQSPSTTLWGILVGGISIATMWALYYAKRRTALLMGSTAMLADANCTKACIWLSVVLVLASVAYEWTGVAWMDLAGSLGIAIFAFREGREAFAKARGNSCCSDHC